MGVGEGFTAKANSEPADRGASDVNNGIVVRMSSGDVEIEVEDEAEAFRDNYLAFMQSQNANNDIGAGLGHGDVVRVDDNRAQAPHSQGFA